MTRDDIIRMAREAGIVVTGEAVWKLCELVRDHLLSTTIHSCHANCERFACVQTRRAVEAEREACAKVCDDLVLDQYSASGCAAAIRARGQA